MLSKASRLELFSSPQRNISNPFLWGLAGRARCAARTPREGLDELWMSCGASGLGSGSCGGLGLGFHSLLHHRPPTCLGPSCGAVLHKAELGRDPGAGTGANPKLWDVLQPSLRDTTLWNELRPLCLQCTQRNPEIWGSQGIAGTALRWDLDKPSPLFHLQESDLLTRQKGRGCTHSPACPKSQNCLGWEGP